MSDLSCYTVALWYYRHGAVDYDLYETEEDAARLAVHLEDYGEASVVGAQFPDGRTVRLGKWPAYQEAVRQEREREACERAEQAARPPIEYRQARDPFGGQPVAIEEGEPAWLGVPK